MFDHLLTETTGQHNGLGVCTVDIGSGIPQAFQACNNHLAAKGNFYIAFENNYIRFERGMTLARFQEDISNARSMNRSVKYEQVGPPDDDADIGGPNPKVATKGLDKESGRDHQQHIS